MTQQIGGQLSKRYEAKTESVGKLVSEIDRLKTEINKQVAAKEKMRTAKENIQVVAITFLITKLLRPEDSVCTLAVF